MPDFDLFRIAEVLSTKYNATWIEAFPIHKNLEAEISLALEGELLFIEISVDPTTIRPTSIHSFDTRTIKPLHPLNIENKTGTYAKHPQVIKYLETIKTDLGIP
ncbi:MAG TPA: hypothetical protein VK503_02825 [Candidatus Bathyarchaeia archaeon]|nr:hypothetical protein [Candidatus Bathyarchaeia archaeon]